MINCHFQYLCVEITGGYTILVSSDKFIEPSKSGKNSKPIIHTAKPGSPTIFAPISFSAWNSAHHRPRKVTPKSFPIVNAARIYHFDNMTSIGMWFPHCERKSHHSKKHVFGGLNWGTVKCFSHCQRHVKSNPIASISSMIFYMWNVLFPLSTPC